MKILSLNCRGLAQSEAVQEVRSLIQLHRPSLVFLSETRIFSDKVDFLLRSFGLPFGMGVGSFGRGGGLALLWSCDIKVKLTSYDRLHFDIVILDPESDEEMWRFTGFYGESRRELRYRNWGLLKFLSSQGNLPWLCAGDFIEILEASEQFGGNTRLERQMDGFREAVQMCGFQDLGFSGLPYTWDNRQEGIHNIKVRLDRGFANQEFLDLFPEATVWHVQTTESDHCCLLIECNRETSNRRHRSFRYENMMRRDESYLQLVQPTWGEGEVANLTQLQSRLGNVQRSLQEWELNVFGSVRRTLARLRNDLERVRARSIGSGPTRKERRLMARISELLSREEIMEKQRSRLDWLRDGDRNTAMFQAKAKERARSNRIKLLRRDDGSVATQQDELEACAVNFYQNLFTAAADLEPEAVLNYVPNKVSDDVNSRLNRPDPSQLKRWRKHSL